MSLKTILIALLPEDEPAAPACLAAMLGVAQASRADVAVAVGAHQVRLGFAIPYPPAVAQMTEENERRIAAAQRLADVAVEAGKSRSLAVAGRIIDGAFDDMVAGFAKLARLNDLVVAAAPGDDDMFRGSLAAALLFETGRPVLFMPPAVADPFDPSTVVIAWDGSQRAARAVGDAMAFIEAAKTVSIISVIGEKDLTGTIPGDELAARLRHHNEHITVSVMSLDGDSVGDVVLRHARKSKAGLVVMGAFAHSRWRELVLGGVTQTLLQTTTVPVLMAH